MKLLTLPFRVAWKLFWATLCKLVFAACVLCAWQMLPRHVRGVVETVALRPVADFVQARVDGVLERFTPTEAAEEVSAEVCAPPQGSSPSNSTSESTAPARAQSLDTPSDASDDRRKVIDDGIDFILGNEARGSRR